MVWLQQLRVRDLRNIREAKLELGPGLNVFVGKNGQGKTSLLEAVGLVARDAHPPRAAPVGEQHRGQARGVQLQRSHGVDRLCDVVIAEGDIDDATRCQGIHRCLLDDASSLAIGPTMRQHAHSCTRGSEQGL